jgi:predicted amidophosphoribosyltransferase
LAPVFKKHDRNWGEIAIFGDYLAWGLHKAQGGDRSDFPEYSGRILDLKDGSPKAATRFGEMVAKDLADGVVVATVPGHDPAKQSVGLRQLAGAIAKDGKRVDCWDCLVRTKKIDKLAHGGDRSEEVHLNSVKVARPAAIKGKDVLLVDDVCNTGHSLTACKKLLLAAGARSVQCAAIGKV